MAKTLELVFKNQSNRKSVISLDEPRDNLTADEVRAVMQDILAKNIFNTSGGDLIQIEGARIISREVTELEL